MTSDDAFVEKASEVSALAITKLLEQWDDLSEKERASAIAQFRKVRTSPTWDKLAPDVRDRVGALLSEEDAWKAPNDVRVVPVGHG